MKANLLNDLLNVVKKGTSLVGSWSQVGRMSEGGAIEHPMSIRSASDGERWKPAGEKGSTRVWKHVAMIFAVLVMSMANIGMAWGLENTINSYNNDSVKSSLWFSIAASPVVSSITGSGSGSAAKAAKNSSGTQITVQSIASKSNVYTMTFGLKSGITVTGVALALGENKLSYIDIKIGSSTFTGSNKDWSLSGLSLTSSFSITFNDTEETGTSNRNTKIKSITFTYTTSGGGDTTPPTLSSSTPANGATDVAVSGNITLTFSENVTINDASKFTLSGGAGTLNTASATASGTVVTIPYSGLANNTTYTLATAAEAVKDGSNNKNAALSNISFTTVAGGGGTTVTATWPMYSENSLSLVGTASNSSITPSNAVATFPSNIAWGAVATVNYTDYTGKMVKITENNTSNITGDNSSISYTTYVKYSLTVATGYTFKPTGFSARIGRQGTDNGCAKVVLKKGTTGIDSTAISKPARDNASTLVASTTYSKLISDADTYEAGDVIDLYVYLGGKMKNKSFVISDVSITGEYAEAATPSCTAPSSVGISGTSSYLPGQNISLTAAATGGSGTPTTYQWYHRGVAIDGATSATYTKSNCTIDDAGNYTCKVTMGGSCSTTSPNFAVRVYSVKVWSNGGGSVIGNYPLTYQSSNNGRAVISTLSASTTYEFKVIDNVGGTSDSTIYYGNGGTIHHNTAIDPATWDFGSTTATNCKLVTGVETGDFTFDVDITHNGTGAGFYVTVNVAYPTKTIYLTPGVWNADGAKFAIHYYDANGGTGWTDFLTANDCGMSAEIPVWDGVKMIAGRFNSTKASTGNWDDKWNQTNDITVSSYNSVVITGWNESDYTYNSNFSTPTYTIGYAKGSVPTGGGSISGSKSNETKTCGIDFTLPSSAVFTTTGYTQTAWTTSDGGAQEYALGGTYTTNEDKTFYPVWTVNNYDLTWNLGGGTTTSAGTGIGSGVSSNTTSSVAFGTALIAPTVTKTGYNFSAWSPAVASTMPAANTTYTAQWTAKTTTITIDANTANHGSTTPGSVTATYGSALPSFTAATGASGWNLTGYFTAATSGTKVINADGTLVASTDYADGSGNWKYETATLTLYPQYEEEGCTPTTASITFNNNVAGKYNTAWVAGDITTSGGATYTLTNTSCDTGHPMTKPAIKGAKNKTLIQIDIPAGATSGTISVSAATYDGGAATIAITNSGGTVLTSKSLSSTTTNADAGSWSAPTLKTASYNITSGGTYYIKETSNSNNIYIYAFSATAEVPCDETAPTFVSSVPANGATGVATSGTIVLTFSEALGTVDASKFTLTGATKGAVAIDGSDATKVNIAYSGAANEATVTLATAAAAVSDLAGNALAAALSNISFTTAAAAPAGDCDELFAGRATSTSVFTPSAGSATFNLSSGNSFSAGGYSYSVKPNSSNAIVASPKAGGSFAAGDSLIVVIYNNESGSKTMGFRLGSGTYSTSVGSKKLHIFRQVLVASDISAGKVTFNRQSSDDRWVEIIIKHCGLLPSCTTPILPTLTAKTICAGGTADAAWDATITNSGSLASGESVSYSWTKKNSSTVLSSVATYQPASVTEAMDGTYVVTATVSADGKASTSASAEVELNVIPATTTPTITADKSKVYAGNSVTLTAACTSSGVTWTWHTCNADGTGASASLGTDATYTIASAGSAGTYYYKAVATGDGTHSCGTAETVYTLTVSTASAGCEDMVIFDGSTMSSVPATDASGTESNSGATWTNVGTATNSYSCSYEYGGKTYTKGWKFTGGATSSSTRYIQIVIPTGYTGNLFMAGYIASTGRSMYVATSPTGSLVTTYAYITPAATNTLGTASAELAAGTYYVCVTDAFILTELSVEVCSTVSCTDPDVTATVDNSTACVGTAVNFSSTGAHASATYQWQKYNGATWDNISGATSATYQIASVTADNAGKYRVVATNVCSRNSNELTLSVPTAPEFESFTASHSVMTTASLVISDVEADGATGYKWYKSSDATYDAGSDTQLSTTQTLSIASVSEAAGSTFYLFCVASNSCASATSSAITVTVTAYVDEECATRGNEGNAEFGFTNTSCSQGSYNSVAVWSTNSNSKYLTYTAPTGKYFATAKVTIASSNSSNAGYAYSTDGGSTWTGVTISDVTTTLTARSFTLPASVNAFRIGRKVEDCGESSGTFYLSEACFTYTESCTATTVTPSDDDPTYDISTGGEFTEPTFTLKNASTNATLAGTFTYSSSNTDIATVDDDGIVEFQGMAGSVTITASYAGGTISATEYCASSGSYTITVTCGSEDAPKIVAAAGTNLSGCNTSITLYAKDQSGNAFASGTYQWYRDGEEIADATSDSYTATRTGVYTVVRTATCAQWSSNSAKITSETAEPTVERLVPFQYYHDEKTYTTQMRYRHLFAVTAYGLLNGKRYSLSATRNGEPLDLSSSIAFSVRTSRDNVVDTVMLDLNALSGKYDVGDEIVFTCAAIDNCNAVSSVTNTITLYVIDDTPTLALICSGADGDGTRSTKKLVVGGDFLTGYNKADLCQQTGSTSFDANTEWGLYTELKAEYNVTPVNGYAEFNKLNYEPFDLLLLTDYPKASKSDAAATILDDMAALCDYRPMLSFKTHMVSKSPSKWADKGFTTSPVVNEADGKLNLNIVCYAHPMFESIKEGADVYNDADNTSAPLVYTMLSGEGYEGNKGMQGFEIAAAENFITIGLTHYNATVAKAAGIATWTPGDEDRMLVSIAERQANSEARFILFSLNAGAHSKLTDKGELVVLKCLDYLYNASAGLITPADCSFTFDNGEGNTRTAGEQATNCPSCPAAGDGKWSNPANWGPDYRLLPGEFTSVRIKKPVNVDVTNAHVMEVRLVDEGTITIPAGKALEVKSTIRRMDDTEITPTENSDIFIGSSAAGNGTLIFNNDKGDSKATVAMYTTAQADIEHMSAATSTWQYIGTPHNDVATATYNYYDSWLYQQNADYTGWTAIPNGGPLAPFRGYCVTHPEENHTFVMDGTLTATTSQEIAIPAGKYVVVANSWTAPIDINAITDDDMEGITEKSIYFFNTGSDSERTGEIGTAAGTYRTSPIHAASYTGDWQIPSMQGFYVVGGASAGTLHLDYSRHVRPSDARSVVGNPMYAPRRSAENNEPEVAKLYFRGHRYYDRLIVLEREDFTPGYDSGWDGEAWGGNEASPMSYVSTEGRWDAVSAIPEFEGTVVGFRAGEDEEYTIDFIYDAENEPLYLFDTENSSYTQIVTGNAYHFSTADKAAHSRFILTHHAPQIATGCENLDDGGGAKAKKLLIEDKMYILLNGMLYDATGKVVK